MKGTVFAAWRWLAAFNRPSKGANAARLRARGEDVSSILIREPVAADIPALARLHVATWNATYAPLLMKGPSCHVRERQWQEAFSRQDGSWFCFVAASPGRELVGFAKGKRSDHPEFAGELNKIFLLREYQGLGLGRRLLGHVVTRFLSQGVNSMWLFGDARNPSSRVWTALGAEKTDDDPGNGNYGWRDLRRLAATLRLASRPLLFSYGTLQQEDVQLRTFGRRLVGQNDELLACEPSLVKIESPEVVAAIGMTHHANVTFNGNQASRVPGMVFEVDDAELAGVDAYEAAFRYRRVAAMLASGREAWVYVHREVGRA